MNKIVTRTLTNELKYNNTTILIYKIDYPEIIDSEYKNGKSIFNMYNKEKAFNLEKYCKHELYKQAKDLYEYNLQNGYPVMIFEVNLTFKITYNNHSLISLYYDQYIFSGGAHGSTARTSQTWDLSKAKMLPLSYFFYDDPYYIQHIFVNINKQISNQIKNEENQYFDNYCELVVKNFNPDNFYLYPDYIVVYYQQYDIAPYSSGIPTFKI